MPAGSTLTATAWYDYSKDNPANPDPTRTVPWGPQTFDEMMIGYVEYHIDARAGAWHFLGCSTNFTPCHSTLRHWC